MKRYAIEIYLPDSEGDEVACLIESDEPFQAIQKGDLINPRSWNSHYSTNLQSSFPNRPHGIVLRVTGIEHFIFQREGGFSQHKLGVFTRAEDDVADSRP